MRKRINVYVDLKMTSREVELLGRGKAVYKMIDGQRFALHMTSVKERIKDKIEELRAKVRKLELSPEKTGVRVTFKSERRPYVKKNEKYWRKKAREMKENSPLYKYHKSKR